MWFLRLEKLKTRQKSSKNEKMQVLSNQLLKIFILKNWKLLHGKKKFFGNLLSKS